MGYIIKAIRRVQNSNGVAFVYEKALGDG